MWVLRLTEVCYSGCSCLVQEKLEGVDVYFMDLSVRGVLELQVLEIEKKKKKTASVKDNEQLKSHLWRMYLQNYAQ
jgi:hypothetical protein